jgi:hypothetical protein
MNNQRDTFEELRRFHFDGNDPFMNGGHQIIKMRQIAREVPTWVKDKRKIQALLLRSFPKLKTDPKQRLRAARWAVIIQLYFRMHMTLGQVTDQVGLPKSKVAMLIRSIHRAAAGRKANGKGVFSQRPTGRPKKQK